MLRTQKEQKKRQQDRDKERKREIERLKNQLEFFEDEYAGFVNDRIRELTHQDAGVTARAIEAVKIHGLCKNYIALKEEELNRPVEIEDFRQDRTLRHWVKDQIVELYKEEFGTELHRHKNNITLMQEKLKQLGM